MVTNGDGCANAYHISALVLERVLILKSAKFSPSMVEFSRHSEEVLAILLKELGTQRHYVIAAPSGGKILKLVVSLIGVILGTVHIRAAVIEYGSVGRIFVNDTRQYLHHLNVLLNIILTRVSVILGIKPLFYHALSTVGTSTRVLNKADIVEDTVRNVEFFTDLTGDSFHIVLISSDRAEGEP